MGLTEALSRAAASRAHVLVAEAPGSFRERAALERAIDANGWRIADAVADADVLAVVGEPGPELAAIIDHVWGQMSEPKVLIDIRDGASVAAGLVEARDALRDAARQHGQAAQPNDSPPAQHDDEHDQPADGHEGHDDGGHEGHGDGGHDHGAMAPDGIPLAEGAEDRDGLEMDELHLPLGPVLAHWPSGVVLRVTLHGDVVAEAEVERLDAHAATALTRTDSPGQPGCSTPRPRCCCWRVCPRTRHGDADCGTCACPTLRSTRRRSRPWPGECVAAACCVGCSVVSSAPVKTAGPRSCTPDWSILSSGLGQRSTGFSCRTTWSVPSWKRCRN